MATYADFLSGIRRTLEEPTEGVWSDTSLMAWCNEGARDLFTRCNVMRDEEYTNSVVGTSRYSLPDSTAALIDVFYDNKKLLRYDLADFYDLDLIEESGTPVAYIVDDESITLAPVPDSVQVIRFYRWRYPSAITATTDNMPLSSRYDSAIAFYVLSRAFEQIGDWDSANAYVGRYEDAVTKVWTQANIEQSVARTRSPRETY